MTKATAIVSPSDGTLKHTLTTLLIVIVAASPYRTCDRDNHDYNMPCVMFYVIL